MAFDRKRNRPTGSAALGHESMFECGDERANNPAADATVVEAHPP